MVEKAKRDIHTPKIPLSPSFLHLLSLNFLSFRNAGAMSLGGSGLGFLWGRGHLRPSSLTFLGFVQERFKQLGLLWHLSLCDLSPWQLQGSEISHMLA